MNPLVCISITLLFFSCSPDFRFSRDANIETLGVKLSYNDTLYPQLEKEYVNALQQFILKYNTERHSFRLKEVDKIDSSVLVLNINSVKLVSRTQQATAIGLQAASFIAIGVYAPVLLATPAAPYVVISSFLPYNRTILDARLSPDINDTLSRPVILEYRKSAYLGSKKVQLGKYHKRLPKLFQNLFYAVESRYKQHKDYYKRKNSSLP